MATQQRVTLILPTDEQTLIYLRTTTRAEVQQQEIYAALDIKPDPLGKRKTSVSCRLSVNPRSLIRRYSRYNTNNFFHKSKSFWNCLKSYINIDFFCRSWLSANFQDAIKALSLEHSGLFSSR
jgi:hypothetical protein